MAGKSKLSPVNQKILNFLMVKGVGVSVSLGEIESILDESTDRKDPQRRIRDLRAFGYKIKYVHREKAYVLLSMTASGRKANVDAISSKLSVEVLLAANGRCQLCGKTVEEDKIKLVVDHRVPRTWGGSSQRENLWAICEADNIAKRDFFDTFDPAVMEKCMGYSLAVQRIGELLKVFKGKMVRRRLLEVVGQEDEWPRRLRELRELGWDVENVHDSSEKGRYCHAYRLVKEKPWPDDIRKAIKEYRSKVKKSRSLDDES